MDQDNKQKQRYFVAVKVFLEKDNQLLIIKDVYGQWDLPGGRIKVEEFEKPFPEIIARKIKEELDEDLKYELDETPKIFMRHKRNEQVGEETEARIFAIGYFAKYISGEVKIPPAHEKSEWVDVNSYKPENDFQGGWLQGLKDYLKIKKQ